MGAPLTTPLTRRDPVYAMTPFSSFFDDFFRDSFSDFLVRPMMPSSTMPGGFVPEVAPVMRARMDVVDKGEMFLVTVDLPGVKKDDINITIEGPRVAINASMLTETPIKEGEQLLYTERVAKSFARSFELPVEVTEVGAEAVYENGLLMLTLPKRSPSMLRKVIVQ